jgi:cell division protein FtsB
MNSVTFGDQPSDKEELVAVLKNCPILTQDTIKIVEQANKIIALEAENAKLKSAVDDLREELSRLQSVVGEEDCLIIEQSLKKTEGLV